MNVYCKLFESIGHVHWYRSWKFCANGCFSLFFVGEGFKCINNFLVEWIKGIFVEIIRTKTKLLFFGVYSSENKDLGVSDVDFMSKLVLH